jgi:hypothetical protein
MKIISYPNLLILYAVDDSHTIIKPAKFIFSGKRIPFRGIKTEKEYCADKEGYLELNIKNRKILNKDYLSEKEYYWVIIQAEGYKPAKVSNYKIENELIQTKAKEKLKLINIEGIKIAALLKKE